MSEDIGLMALIESRKGATDDDSLTNEKYIF